MTGMTGPSSSSETPTREPVSGPGDGVSQARRKRRWPVVISLVGAAALLAYVAVSRTGWPGSHEGGAGARVVSKGDPASFYMQASDQKTDGTNVVIDRVILRGASGYVAIHPQHGEPWPLIGASRLLPEGETRNVVVPLTQPLEQDATVFPMLHVEENGNSTFNFPDADLAAEVDDELVVFPIEVEVRG